MNETKHTPGPWMANATGGLIVMAGPDGKNRIELARVNYSIGGLSCGACSNAPDISTSQANARLIAAAPELLEACETAYHELRIRCGYKPGAAAYDLLAQVIEKAIGSQPWLHKVPGDKP